MILQRLAALLFLAAMLPLAGQARAQRGSAHIAYAYPAGGSQASSFQLVVGGQNLEATTDIIFSGPGVKATVIDHFKPLAPGQFQIARAQLNSLLEKKEAANGTGKAATQPAATKPSWTAADEARVAELKKRLAKPPKRIENPALAETVTLQVTIDPNAATGDHELRLRTLSGLTNPVRFCVSQLPEFAAKDLKTAIPLPAVVNGQIMPGAVDQFRIQAKKGQRLVVVTAARALKPYISDAVPGWFQAAVTLHDSSGRELAFADHFRFDPDPVLSLDIPANGEYTVEIRDSIYRGREDFVYRITLGELPYITSIFPTGGPAGSATTVELTGWNLPTSSVTFDATNKKPGVYPISVGRGATGGLTSNRVPFAVDALPEINEPQPNTTASSAPLIPLPAIVNGKIDRPGESDFYRFEGKAGQEIVAQVFARRLRSPLDSLLKLIDPSGKQIALNDDHEDKASALHTHHADSRIAITLPATGVYTLQLSDTQRKGGEPFAYRLRIGPPSPDFALRITPPSLGVRGGASIPLTVYALRQDGFNGDIAVSLKNAPAGFSLSGAKIPAGKEDVTLTLKAPNLASDQPVNLTFQGTAIVAGQRIVHEAVPAQDLMQAFYYHHLVPTDQLLVAVTPRPLARGNARILTKPPIKLAPGASDTIKTTMPTETPFGRIELELVQPIEGIAIKSIAATPEGSDLVLHADASKLKPGASGNLIINMILVRNAPAAEAGRPSARRRIPMGALPAIPYEVTATSDDKGMP